MQHTIARGMTRRERVEAAFRGDEVDFLPVTFWHHFPGQDHAAGSLAEATIALQSRYGLDLVRLVPTGMYSVIDYGMSTRLAADGMGSTEFISGPIQEPEDWRRLPAVSPHRGSLGEQSRTVRLVRAGLGTETPMVQTIFSPLTMAIKLAGGTLGSEILDAGQAIHDGLARLADDAIAFGQACLDNGADGVFFLAMHSNGSIDRATYDEFGTPYDLRVLEALRPRSWCMLVHLHGRVPYFDLAGRYPVDAVSWEDRETEPSLVQAMSLTNRCLVGGIGRNEPMVHGTAGDVRAQVRSVLEETGGRRVIVAPGCTLSGGVPAENLQALVAMAHEGV